MDFPDDDNLLSSDSLDALLADPGAALDALGADLVPPSPILTPSQVAFSWSSGSIPVLLYDEAYAADDAEGQVTFTELHGSRSAMDVGSLPTGVDDAELDDNERLAGSSTQTCRVSSADREPLSSRRASCTVNSHSSLVSGASASSTGDDQAPRRPSLSQVSAQARPALTNSEKEVSRWSADSDSVFLSDSASSFSDVGSVHKKGTPASLQLNTVNPSIVINSTLSVDSIPAEDDNEGPAFQTPTKASLQPAVSWISSRSWDYDKYEAYVAREEPARHALISNSLETYVASQPDSQGPVTPPNKREALSKRDVNVLSVDTPRADRHNLAPTGSSYNAAGTKSADSELDHRSHHPDNTGAVKRTGSPRRHSVRPAARVRESELDDNSWLEDVSVQMLIDQEGFRAAEPTFRYGGTARVRINHNGAGSRGSTSALPKVETVQMAHFRMTKRESYHFHHAPFETAPILRRVTVNGDETHDYVSKQAMLTLKLNGVYVLQGQESLVQQGHGHSHTHTEEATRLHWRLEYLVDDRIIDLSQRVMDGEKVVRLLSFSCSPALLLPTQAKKNTIMHVFKKSVAPKLVAEKLQPPGMTGSSSGANGQAPPPGAGSRLAPTNVPVNAVVSHAHGSASDAISSSQTHGHITPTRAKTHGWGGMHRRGQSHNIRPGTTHGELVQKAVTQGQEPSRHRTSPSQGHVQYSPSNPQERQYESNPSPNKFGSGTRRRNSCLGARPSPGGGVMGNTPFTMVSSSLHHWEPANSPPPDDSAHVSPPRHILPPEQLTKLLDSIATPDSVEDARQHSAMNLKAGGKLSMGMRSFSGRVNSAVIGGR